MTESERLEKRRFEAGFVFETMPIPKRICEWWRHDGCRHDPADDMCQWPNCPTDAP